LKTVARLTPANIPLKEMQWSIRQGAFHHQFDVVNGLTLWIVTRGGLDIKERIEQLTKKNGRPEDRAFSRLEDCFQSTMSIHLLYCYWSTEEWRWYLQWLEEVVEQETQIAVAGPLDAKYARREYQSKDLQSVQDYEDKTNEATMILEANVDVLTALRKFYESLMRHKDFPVTLKTACEDDVLQFATQLDDMVYDAKMQISRAKLLVRIIGDRKSLVCITFFFSFNSPRSMYPKRCVGHPTSANPDNRKNGSSYLEYAQNRPFVTERYHHNAHHYRWDLTIPASDFCFDIL
jgi:hypothetical protein